MNVATDAIMARTGCVILLCWTGSGCVRGSSTSTTGPLGRPLVEVTLMQREDDRVTGPYYRAVSYAAEYRWEPFQGARTLVHTETGLTDAGRFVLRYPPGCTTLTGLTLDVMPSFEHCRASSVAAPYPLSCTESHAVTVAIGCDGPTRRAKLQALAWLDCHEREIEVTQLSALRFHVEGCGESFDLLCNIPSLQAEWSCEPYVCHGHNRLHDTLDAPADHL